MVYFLLFPYGTALAALIILSWQQRRIALLESAVQEKSEIIERTSKLLIEKNLNLSDQNIRLQKLLEAKTDFIGIASHQLRTPATEIKWGVDILREGSLGELTKEQREHVEKLYTGAQKMVRLIDDLLKLVNLEEGYRASSRQLDSFDRLIEDTVAKIQQRFKDKNIRIIYELTYGDKPASIDVDSMVIVISNLVENAFYYTSIGGTITLKSALTDKKDLSFSISDTGIGIPKSKQEAIFKKFQRGEAAMQMNSGGIGLGLYIVKNIVERYQGTVAFKSEEGKGASFSFTIPQK